MKYREQGSTVLELSPSGPSLHSKVAAEQSIEKLIRILHPSKRFAIFSVCRLRGTTAAMLELSISRTYMEVTWQVVNIPNYPYVKILSLACQDRS